MIFNELEDFIMFAFPTSFNSNFESDREDSVPAAPSGRRLRVVLALVRLDLNWYAWNFLVLMMVSLMRMLFDGDMVPFEAFCVVALNTALLSFVRGSNPGAARLLTSLPLRRSEVVFARYAEGVSWIAATALLGAVLIWANAVFGDHSAGMWRSLVGLIVALVVDLAAGLPLVIRFRTRRAWLCAGLVSLAVGIAVSVLIGFMARTGARIHEPGLLPAAGGTAVGLGVLALVASYRMSARFYARQDH